MSFIRKNIWGIGFIVVLGGALLSMWLANKNSNVPSAFGTAQETASFSITADDNIKGPETAKVTLVEFSDFQCPACKAYATVIDDLLAEFPNDLRVVYKFFPLKSIHFRAQASAQAAEAAGRQGKFFEMSRVLFENQEIWSRESGSESFEKYASDLGLDLEKFKTDYNSDSVKDKINAQLKEGIDLNVNGTPTIYLNGKKISNPNSFEQFKQLIEAEIRAVSGGTPANTEPTPSAI
jgi:protein-disulfide isomerase